MRYIKQNAQLKFFVTELFLKIAHSVWNFCTQMFLIFLGGSAPINRDWHWVKLAGGNPRNRGRAGKMGLQEIRKLLFPIGRYAPRCDKRRKRDDRRLLFFFLRSPVSPPFAFSNARRLHEVIFLRGGRDASGGTFQKHLVFSHSINRTFPRFRCRHGLVTFVLLPFVSNPVRTRTAERLVRSTLDHVEMLTFY